jgi:hypothetical protein
MAHDIFTHYESPISNFLSPCLLFPNLKYLIPNPSSFSRLTRYFYLPL